MGINEGVNPGALLDWACWYLGLRADRALSGVLGLSPQVMSKLRHGRQPLGPTVLVRVLEVTDLRLRDLPGRIRSTRCFWARPCRRPC